MAGETAVAVGLLWFNEVMANENTPQPQDPHASGEPDPWATMPRSRLNPPPGDDQPSPFARPAGNPWEATPRDQPNEAPEQPGQQGNEAESHPAEQTGERAPSAPYPSDSYPPVAPDPSGTPYPPTASYPPITEFPPAGQVPPPYPASAPTPPPYPASAPSASYPPAGHQASYPPPGQPAGWPPVGQPQNGPKDANPLVALFDFGFTKFATPGLVKVVYLLAVVAAVGTWLMWVIAGFTTPVGFGTRPNPALGMTALLLGWVPALLSIAFTRFVLEGVVALIRIHDRVDELAERGREDEPDA